MATRPKHPVERTGTVLMAMGAIQVVGSLCQLSFGVAPLPWVFLASGAFFTLLGVYSRVTGPLAMLINQSLNALKLGRAEEARALLAEVGARTGHRLLLRPYLMQQAELALRDGHVDESLLLLERANRVPLGVAAREHARMQRDDVRASIALLRAGRGDETGARAAIATAISDAATATTRARVVVAELVLLSRAGDREALRQTLEANRPLLFDATSPRERVLVRGLDRMLDQPRPDPYREPSKAREREASTTVAEWVRALAPEVAEFVVDRHLVEGATETVRFATPSTEAAKRVAVRPQALGLNPRDLFRAVSLSFLALAIIGAAVFVALNAMDGPSPLVTTGFFLWGPIGVIAAGIVAWSARKGRLALRPLRESALAIAMGDHAKARELLAPLLRASLPLFHATAALNVGVLEAREGEFAKALERYNEALGLLSTRAQRTVAYDLLLPQIHAERAFVLAALGREEDSTAEANRFEREFPAYALRGAAEFRVKITQLVRRGDYAEAARLGRERSVHMQLPRHEELLLDVLDAVDRGEDELTPARLAREIEQDAHLRHWFEHLAPELVARLYAKRLRAPARAAETPEAEDEGVEAGEADEVRAGKLLRA